MPAARHQRLLDGAFPDPAERYRCQIFDAIGAIVASVIPEAAGAAIGGEALGGALAGGALDAGLGGAALGGFSSLAGPEIAGLTAGEVLGGAGGALGLGEAAGALGGLGDVLGGLGGSTIEGLGGAAGGLVPGGALTTGAAVAPEAAAPALSAGTAVGGPAAAAPIAPASIGTVAPTVTGDLTATAGAGGPFGTGLTEADYAAINSAPGMSGGGDLGTTGAASATGSKGGLIDRTLSSLTGGALNKSDLGTVLSGGGLLMNLMGGNKSLPGEKQLSGAASNLSATAAGQAALGTQLEGFLQSGKLPPGVESGLRSATNAVHAKIKSNYAARGMSGSSAEAQDIQAANDRAFEAGQQVAMQLLQQGSTLVGQAVGTEGLAASLYEQILANSLQKDKDFGQALGNFSSALARSDQPTSITLKTAA